MGFWAFGRRRKRRKTGLADQDPDVAEKSGLPAQVNRTMSDESRDDEKTPMYAEPRTPASRPINQRSTNGKDPVPSRVDMSSYHYAKPQTGAGPSFPHHAKSSSALAGQNISHPSQSGFSPMYLREDASKSDFSFSRPSSWTQAPTLVKPSISKTESIRRSGSARRKDRPEDTARLAGLRNSTGPVAIPVPYRRYIEDDEDRLPRHGKGVAESQPVNGDRRDSRITHSARPSIQLANEAPLDPRALKVRSMDVLNPRPSLKGGLTPSNSQRRRPRSGYVVDPPERPKTPLVAHEDATRRRIDDLADSFDAATLHQVMDRDQRRREEKRARQSQRAKQKLLDMQTKQRAEDSEKPEKFPSSTTDEKATESTIAALNSTSRQPSYPPPIASPVVRQEVESPQSTVPHPASPKVPLSPLSKRQDASSTQASEVPDKQTMRVPTTSQRDASPDQLVSSTDMLFNPSQEVESMAPPPPPGNMYYSSSRDSSEVMPGRSVTQKRSSGGRWSSILKPLNKHRSRDSDGGSSMTPKSIRYSETGSNSDFSVNRQHTAHQDFRPPYSGTSIRRRSGTPTRTKSRFKEDLPDAMPLWSEAMPFTNGDSTNETRVVMPASIPELSSVPSPTYPPSFTASPSFPAMTHMNGHATSSDERNIRKSASGLSYEGEELSYSQSYASVDSESSWMRPSRRTSRINHQSSRSSINNGSSRRHTHDGLELGDSLSGLDVLAEKDVEAELEHEHDAGVIGSSDSLLSSTHGTDTKTRSTNGGSGSISGNGSAKPHPSISELPANTLPSRPPPIPARSRNRIPPSSAVPTTTWPTNTTAPTTSPTPTNPFEEAEEEDEDERAGVLAAASPDEFEDAALEDLDGAEEKEKMVKHARHISAGSARLLDIVAGGSASGSAPGSKRSSRLEAL